MMSRQWMMGDARRLFPRPSTILAWIIALLVSPSALAKAPTLDSLFPGGGVRGSNFEVTAGGQFERWPVRVWTSTPGLKFTPGTEKGKLTVTIAADLSPGVYWVRLFDDEGPTAPRPFLVGLIPEINEVEPNDEPARAQPVKPSAVTINGRLEKPGEVDGFRVALKQGQTLVSAIEANRTLGSPMDAVLQVATPEGFVLAQNDDELDRDPRIVFTAPRDGDFVVRVFAFPFVQDSTIRFAGNANDVYRLTLTTAGYADHTMPLAVTRGAAGEVEAVGWNLDALAQKLVILPSSDDTAIVWNPSVAAPVEVRQVDFPSIVAVEMDEPMPVSWPVAISGRIDKPGDVDVFSFSAHKNETLLIRVDSRELGQALDAVLRVHDASGATLTEVDDFQKGVDPEVRFNPPTDGAFRVSIRDLNGHGGLNFAYLLTIEKPRPDFRLTVKGDSIALTPGAILDLVVKVERVEGFAEPVEVVLADRFDGVIVEPATSKFRTATAGSVTLKLKGCDCVQPGPIQVLGTSESGRRRRATAPVAGLNRSIDSLWLSKAVPPVSKPTATSAPN